MLLGWFTAGSLRSHFRMLAVLLLYRLSYRLRTGRAMQRFSLSNWRETGQSKGQSFE